ncbi:hypothetical protein NE237_003348 [Protea cynaroides]|uniref:Uncharacterized protein n=1 Tax=Protea cynaroides TaxID=273540 RepID=A0A9Q0KGV5_9MAGN|nr:hypothetical protein NE237_003348 [Protea cynaroides]
MGSETFIEVILAILLPPVGVFLRYGCGIEFWIDLLLTVLGYIPGIIYALYVLHFHLLGMVILVHGDPFVLGIMRTKFVAFPPLRAEICCCTNCSGLVGQEATRE